MHTTRSDSDSEGLPLNGQKTMSPNVDSRVRLFNSSEMPAAVGICGLGGVELAVRLAWLGF